MYFRKENSTSCVENKQRGESCMETVRASMDDPWSGNTFQIFWRETQYLQRLEYGSEVTSLFD